MDKYRMDSHKLLYHVDRVSDWKAGRNVYPIYIEVSPAGACNQRCRFCGKDFIGYQRRKLDWTVFRERLQEMGRLGVRSIMHAGEGEPLLHENIIDIVQTGKASGIDQAVNTNGVLFTPDKAAGILPHAEWVRFSVDAAAPDTYAYLHGARPADFHKVIDNIREAARLRRENGWRCTLGIQLILLPENRGEVVALAALARELGADYLVVKPYSQNPHGITHEFEEVNYREDVQLGEELAAYNTPGFNVIFRVHAMQKWDNADRSYERCSAMAFWTYIDAGASLWGCCNHHGDSRFLLGNLYENTFQEIWEGERRREMMEWATTTFDISRCRINCRMDEVNRYLWEIKHPPHHVNFI